MHSDQLISLPADANLIFKGNAVPRFVRDRMNSKKNPSTTCINVIEGLNQYHNLSSSGFVNIVSLRLQLLVRSIKTPVLSLEH